MFSLYINKTPLPASHGNIFGDIVHSTDRVLGLELDKNGTLDAWIPPTLLMLWISFFCWNVWNNKAEKITCHFLRNWSRTKNIFKKHKKWFKISKTLIFATLKLHKRKKISKKWQVILAIIICVKLCHNNNINSITTVEVIQRSLQFWLIKLKL